MRVLKTASTSTNNMATSESTKRKKSTAATAKPFFWTDDELYLLLQLTTKPEKPLVVTTGRQSRASTRIFLGRYPSTGNTEQFPNIQATDVFTKDRLIAKVKRIKQGFRKAIDSGRRS